MKEVELYASLEGIFKITLHVLEELKYTVDSEDLRNKMIIASKGTSIWSWGEEIHIKFFPHDKGVQVRVESRSTAQLIDWGQNKKNELEIINGIIRLSVKL